MRSVSDKGDPCVMLGSRNASINCLWFPHKSTTLMKSFVVYSAQCSSFLLLWIYFVSCLTTNSHEVMFVFCIMYTYSSSITNSKYLLFPAVSTRHKQSFGPNSVIASSKWLLLVLEKVFACLCNMRSEFTCFLFALPTISTAQADKKITPCLCALNKVYAQILFKF